MNAPEEDMEDITLRETIEAPLLHEFNELLEKERLLMELRLLDQEVDANEWKDKYETLRGNVVEGNLATTEQDYLGNLEDLGELEDYTDERRDELVHRQLSTKEDFNAILLTRVDTNYADLSNLDLSPKLFSLLIKNLFGVRSDYEELTILDLQDGTVNDSHLSYLIHALRNPRLKALNLAKNAITEAMLDALLDPLRNRRATPQYLLLHGNSPLAMHSKIVTHLLHVLSSQTWGLTLSLQDLLNNPREANAEALQKNSRKMKKDPSLAYRSVAQQPMCVLVFLKVLNEKLAAAQRKEEDALRLTAVDKKNPKRAVKKAVLKVGLQGKIEARTANCFDGLAVFGLREYQLSPPTMDCLSSTLQLMRASLTDLDLSFSYMGFRGAKMISQALENADCQLVNLNLRSNLFSDIAAESIATSLRKNRSLTALNIGGNCFSDSGANVLADASMSHLFMARLILTNNPLVTQKTKELWESRIANNGSTLWIQFDTESAINSCMRDAFTSRDYLYFRPNIRFQYSGINCWRRLMRINLVQARRSIPSPSPTDALMVRWMMRPAPVEDLAKLHQRLIETMKYRTTTNAAYDAVLLEEPFLFLNMGLSLCWEVRLLDRHKRVIDRVSGNFNHIYFPVRNFVSVEPLKWMPCHAIFQSAKWKSASWAQVRVLVKNCKPKELRFDSSCCLGIETILCHAHVLPMQELHSVGSDDGRESAEELQNMIEVYFAPEKVTIPEISEHRILRAFTWKNKTASTAHVSFQCKLATVAVPESIQQKSKQLQKSLNETVKEVTETIQEQQIYYEWTVSVHYRTGLRRIVRSMRSDYLPGATRLIGQPDPRNLRQFRKFFARAPAEDGTPQTWKDDEDEEEGEDSGLAFAPANPLQAWTWQNFKCDVDSLHSGDIVVLSGRLLAAPPEIVPNANVDEIGLRPTFTDKSTLREHQKQMQAQIAEMQCKLKVRDFEVHVSPGPPGHYSAQQLTNLLPGFSNPWEIFSPPYTVDLRTEKPEERSFDIRERWNRGFAAIGSNTIPSLTKVPESAL